MNRISYIPFEGTIYLVSGDTDLVEVRPDDDTVVKARGFCIGQIGELGDTAEEDLDLRLIRMTPTVTTGSTGTGGGAASPFYPGSGAAETVTGYTAEVFNSGIATTSGSTHTLSFPWNLRNTPYVEWFPDENYALSAKEGGSLILRIATAVADNVDVKGWLAVQVC